MMDLATGVWQMIIGLAILGPLACPTIDLGRVLWPLGYVMVREAMSIPLCKVFGGTNHE